MQAIGFFRDVPHGLPRGPSLHEAVADPLPESERARLVTYLRGAPVEFATSERVPDVLGSDPNDLLSIDIHSDGSYVWPDQCAHYVETYGARLPDDFIRHVLDQDGPPSDADVPQDLTQEILAAMRALR